jgi:acyl-CoA reductase-like NAD-dependent aldehyde dehydrogenase
MTVRAGMVAFEDELFGPVIALLCAADEAEAKGQFWTPINYGSGQFW